MKRVFAGLLGCILLFGMCTLAAAHTPVIHDSDWPVFIDGQKVAFSDSKNLKIDGSEVVPVKYLCRYLGYTLTQDPQSGLIAITEGEACKNSEGLIQCAELFLGVQTAIHYTTKQGEADALRASDDTPLFYVVGDEIYTSPYYLGRFLNLKVSSYAGQQVHIYTRNYLAQNIPQAVSTISVSDVAGELKILYNGGVCNFTAKPFVDAAGRTQVPVRELCEWLDMPVTWYADSQTVGISSVSASYKEAAAKLAGGGAGGDSYWFTIGEERYRRNGTYYEMDTTAQIIDGRAYVPLRYLAQAMGYEVAYNAGS